MQFTSIQSLQNEVECFIISENETTLPYTVLPGTALVLGFQYRGKLALVANGQENGLAISGITGLQNRFNLFKNIEPAASVLVRFKPGGAAAFFPLPLHELFARSIPLEALIGSNKTAMVEELLHEAGTDQERISIVESFLLALRRNVNNDLLVKTAIIYINDSAGIIRVSDLAKALHTSASPLEKRFRAIVGCSPKKYAGIIRFRGVLNNYNRTSPAARSYDAGYFDQAHFIKDFKHFTGQTPEDFFSTKK